MAKPAPTQTDKKTPEQELQQKRLQDVRVHEQMRMIGQITGMLGGQHSEVDLAHEPQEALQSGRHAMYDSKRIIKRPAG